jgi:hypothetical protein
MSKPWSLSSILEKCWKVWGKNIWTKIAPATNTHPQNATPFNIFKLLSSIPLLSGTCLRHHVVVYEGHPTQNPQSKEICKTEKALLRNLLRYIHS